MSGVDDEPLAALRRTAELYAIGADRRDPALWRDVLAEDCVISGPGFTLEGIAAAEGALAMLERDFRRTRHLVHQQHAVVAGENAHGETYCTADHLLRDADSVLRWHIRYQDQRQRREGNWQFTRRELTVDWEETLPVTAKGAA